MMDFRTEQSLAETMATGHVKAAEEFMRDCRGVEGVQYQWVLDHAIRLWKDADDAFNAIDNKADAVIRSVLAVSGIVTLGAISQVDKSNAWVIWWMLPSLGAALASVLFAMSARRPRGVPPPPSVQQAKEFADAHKDADVAIGNFIGYWHLTRVSYEDVCARKAAPLNLSMRASVVAAFLLVMPLVAIAVNPPPSKNTAPAAVAK